MGAERLLAGASALVTDLFPYWEPLDEVETDFIWDAGLAGAERQQTWLSTKTALHIPGTFHLLENIQGRLLAVLTSFTDVKSSMESVCHCFHYEHIRARFVETCLIEDMAVLRPLFKKGPPLFEGGRVWGVTVAITDWLLSRRFAIQQCWDEDKVQFRRARHQGHGEEQEVADEELFLLPALRAQRLQSDKHVRATTAASSDPFFWAVMELVSVLSSVISHLEAWIQGCACHPPALCVCLQACQL